MISNSQCGHIGGSLSIVEIIAVLHFLVMKKGDKFILSKGHAASALYSVLSLKGKIKRKELKSFGKFNSRLQTHPINCVDGIEIVTGSLGQGLSTALGMALARKNRVYCLLGDGELQEGQVWEAAMAASHYKLANLCAIVDVNKLQLDGETKKVMDLGNLKKKFSSFGWKVISCNGHKISELILAFKEAKKENKRPQVILADTVKGKGVSFMENKVEWHGQIPDEKQKEKALEEIWR